MLRLFILGVGGALGTLSRYLLDGFIQQLFGFQFPYGTLVVNVSGCLVIGFLGTLADEKFLFGPHFRTIIFLGFLGAFTTFSTFAYETWVMLKESQFFYAGLNVLLNIIVCFIGLLLGVFLARLL